MSLEKYLPLLSIENLSINGESEIILHIPHLVVKQKEFVAIIGPSGAGKSQLLLTLCGFRTNINGLVWFLDYTIHDLSPAQKSSLRQKIGIVQDNIYPLLKQYTLFEQLKLQLQALGWLQEELIINRLEHCAAFMEIEYENYTLISKLTRFEQVKAMLMRALINKPSFLLIDDIFVGLKQADQIFILEKLNYLVQHENLSILLCTQQEQWLKYAPEVLTYYYQNGAIITDKQLQS